MVCNAIRRLMLEYKSIKNNPIENAAACPKNEDNLLEWEVVLVGPDSSPYENGFFIAELIFPENYPMEPPKMKFITKIIHPNIYMDGRVCISTLHSAGDDPFGYEERYERWSPAVSIEKIVISVLNMLYDPNFDSPANVDAAKLKRENPKEYDSRIKKCVADSLQYTVN